MREKQFKEEQKQWAITDPEEIRKLERDAIKEQK